MRLFIVIGLVFYNQWGDAKLVDGGIRRSLGNEEDYHKFRLVLQDVCNFSMSSFRTTVSVLVEDNATSFNSNEDSDIMAQAFSDTYNEVTQRECDPFFRTITNVTVVSSGYLQSRTTKQPAFALDFVIGVSYCADCVNDSVNPPKLFDPIADRGLINARRKEQHFESQQAHRPRRILGKKNKKKRSKRRPKPTPTSVEAKPTLHPTHWPTIEPSPVPTSWDPCTSCVLDDGIVTPRSAQSFQGLYHSSLVGLGFAQDTTVTVAETIEVANCDAVIEFFEAFLLVEYLAAEPDAATMATTSELELLGVEFRSSYNNLQEVGCDPDFRSINNVSIDILGSSRRQLQSLDEAYSHGRRLGVFVLTGQATVKGQCRGYGCSTSTKTTSNNASPTRSPASSSSSSSRSSSLFANRVTRHRVMLVLGDNEGEDEADEGDDSRLLHLASSHLVARHRDLAAAGPCFCLPDAEFRAPLKDEFVDEYSAAVTDLYAENLLSTVVGFSGNLTEVDSAVTVAPETLSPVGLSFPTSIPSPAPSQGPA
jgi:hypothetical protein